MFDVGENIREGDDIRSATLRNDVVGDLLRKKLVKCRVPFLRSIPECLSGFEADCDRPLFPKEIQQAAVVTSDIENRLATKPAEFLFAGLHQAGHALKDVGCKLGAIMIGGWEQLSLRNLE